MPRTNGKAIEKMDVRKAQSSATSKKMDGLKVVEFVGEVKQELKKVEWTDKEELKSYTKIVLLSIFFFGMFVYFIDLIIQGVLGSFNLIIKFFTG
ncbi:MAG: preprotein translocase subunit SecE [Chlamydiales bacterium]